jgi:hypothetical protein
MTVYTNLLTPPAYDNLYVCRQQHQLLLKGLVGMRNIWLILVLVLLFPVTASAQLDLDSAKKKCIDLGFKSGAEQYGKCVLQLSKVEEVRKAPQQVQSSVQTNTLPQCVGDFHTWNKCIGSKTSANGVGYVGEYRAGMSHGQGKLLLANGDTYVGEFREFALHGQGVYSWSNGQIYAGEFSYGWRNGQGTMTRPDGSVSHSGLWAYDKPVK